MYNADFKDFVHEEVGEICIETINFARATLKEANVFNELLQKNIKNCKVNIIADLSNCDFVDSSFKGILVVYAKKSLIEKIKFIIVIREGGYVSSLFKTTRLERVLTIYQTRSAAMKHFIN